MSNQIYGWSRSIEDVDAMMRTNVKLPGVVTASLIFTLVIVLVVLWVQNRTAGDKPFVFGSGENFDTLTWSLNDNEKQVPSLYRSILLLM